MKDKIKLSASKINTVKKCSWLYYCKYILKLPEEPNMGAQIGSVVHLILECLSKHKHKNHLDTILENRDVNSSRAVKELILKHFNRIKGASQPELKHICAMTWLGLTHDFCCEGSVNQISEAKFQYESENFYINGIIDREIDYGNKIVVRDYKTGKNKFSQEELDNNDQAMMYSLAIYKKTSTIPEVEFIFLNPEFKENKAVKFDRCNIGDLEGYSHYLHQIANYLNNFNEKTAKSDLAANKPYPKDGFSGPRVCGTARKMGELRKDGKKRWCCAYKFGFDYYVMIDEEKKIVKTSFNDDLVPSEKQTVKKMRYNGCPAFKRKSGDIFDFD